MTKQFYNLKCRGEKLVTINVGRFWRQIFVLFGNCKTTEPNIISQSSDKSALQQAIYRTLHTYKLFWAVCHLFPHRWRTLTYSASGNHWPGGPRDMFKTTSAGKFKSYVFEPPTRRVFSINTSSSNTLVLFYQISSQRQHTTSSVN